MEPNFLFGIIALPNSTDHNLELYCTIPEMEGVLRGFVQYFNTLDKIANAERALANPSMDNNEFGANEHSVIISETFVEFDFYLKEFLPFKELYPLKLTISQFQNFLNAAKDTLQKYESCQIPGLLPNSKFDTWSIVSNNNIHQSYFTERNARIQGLLDKISYNEKDKMLNLIVKAHLLERDLNLILETEIPKSTIGRLAIQKSLNEFLERKCYSGYELNVRVYANLIRIKCEQLDLPESFFFYASEQLGHKGFTVDELELKFGEWNYQLNSKEGIKAIAREISDDEMLLEKHYHFIKRYPTILFELKWLLTNFTSVESRNILNRILNSKLKSNSSNEHVVGKFYHDYIKAKMIELDIQEGLYDEIRGMSFDDISEEQIIDKMKQFKNNWL